MADNKPRLNALDSARDATHTLVDLAYSGIVKKLRWALPAAAMVILSAMIIWPYIQDSLFAPAYDPPKVDRATIEKAAAENKLMDAMFSSVNEDGKPFSIVADEATADPQNPDHIILQKPRGTLQMSDGMSLFARAATGLYQQTDQLLDLTNNVELERSDGTLMSTRLMHVNLQTNDAHTDTPVNVTGPQGTLEAIAMQTKNGGNIIIFKGPARLELNTTSSIKLTKGKQ